MADCNSCASKGSCSKKEDTCGISSSKNNKNIKKVIGVLSGKGGVGKSTTSVLLAKALRKQGYKVGILDADITGPSIPRLLGLQSESAYGNDDGIIPLEDKDGILMMSVNNMISNENMPVLWRGSMISKTILQLWNDVQWGELDYLFIDMPPGTGDVALTIMQQIPLTGVVMVSIPQDMISMIVGKALNMCKQLDVKILGVIENMAYISCPDCDKKIYMYDEHTIEPFLKQYDLPLLGQLPMVRAITHLNMDDNYSSADQAEIDSLINPIVEKIK